jgi:phosphatidate cytidylyltransferase
MKKRIMALQKISDHTKRLVSASIFIPVFLFSVFSPFDYHLVFLVLWLIISGSITHEIVLIGRKHEGFQLPLGFPLAINFGLIIYFYFLNFRYIPGLDNLPTLALPSFVVMVTLILFLPQFVRRDLVNSISSVGIGWVAVIYGGVFIAAGVEIVARDPFFFLYLTAASWLGDTACYYMGRLFGKHPLHLPASPNKTFEGYIGGLLLGVALTVGFFWGILGAVLGLLPVSEAIYQQYKEWGMVVSWTPAESVTQWFWTMPWWLVILSTMGFILIGFLGDLMESIIKRSAHIKDSGYIPGHGGTFDVFDSLLLIFPVGLALIYWLESLM